MKNEIFYIPNLISLFRIFLNIPLSVLFLTNPEKYYYYIIGIIILMYITDLTDGYIARKMNLISETGKIIDPLADKLTVLLIALMLLYKEMIPLWWFLTVVLRDLLILVFGLYLKYKRRIVLMSDYAGKITVFIIGLILLLTIINIKNYELLNEVVSYFYYISVLFIIYSLINYLNRFLKIYGENNYGK